MMKEILLQEDNKKIFGPPLSSEEYLYYNDNKDVMRTMWKEQGQAFWLNTLTKFRVYIIKHSPLAPFNTAVKNGALDFPFVIIAQKMTGSFGDVSEFISDTFIVLQNMHLAANMMKSTFAYDPFINPTTRNSFRNLFGPPDNKIRILRTLVFTETFCSWSGTLIRLLPIWKTAQRVTPAAGLWSPASSYIHPSPLRAGPFEQYLKNNWKDKIFAVCGAPPEQLIWWKSVRVGGRTTLPPLEEHKALSFVLASLVNMASEPDDGAGPDSTRSKPPPKTKKASPAAQAPAAEANPAKKKKKKPKTGKATEAAETCDKQCAKPDQAAAAAAGPVRPFPMPPRIVTHATLEWHEYVTAVVGTDRLLRNQVEGGALQLGWASLAVKELLPRIDHVRDDIRNDIKVGLNKVSDSWASAKSALRIKGSRSTPMLKKERDELFGRIAYARNTLRAVTSASEPSGANPVDDLRRITSAVGKTLNDPLLRLYPVVFQYSVTETVDGDPQLVYPDFDRIRYMMKKGQQLLSAPPPDGPAAAKLQIEHAITWYPELKELPKLIESHISAGLSPEQVFGRRLANRQFSDFDPMVPIWTLTEKDKRAAMVQIFAEVGGWSGTATGPLPPRPARLLPHSGQSLVDLYWARLAAILFVSYQLGMIPLPSELNKALKSFKSEYLGVLFDSVVELQLAQCRWLYPRSELELPGRPVFCRPAGLDLITTYLDHTDMVLKATHERIGVIYRAVKKSYLGRAPDQDEKLWTESDTPLPVGGYSDERFQDFAIPLCLTGVALLSQKRTMFYPANGQVLPAFMVAIQDYRAELTKRTWQAIVDMQTKFAAKLTHTDVEKAEAEKLVGRMEGMFRSHTIADLGGLVHREDSVRYNMQIMSNICAYGTWAGGTVSKDRSPPAAEVTVWLLDIAANALRLDAGSDQESLASGRPVPGPPKQRLRLNAMAWSTLLTSAELCTSSSDWRPCVPEPAAAAGLLARHDRRSPDAAAKEACAERSGKSKAPCPHQDADRLLCTILQTLRNIRFAEHVLQGLSDAGISVHCSVVNVLRECLLPYALCADRVFRKTPASLELLRQHSAVISECRGWAEAHLTSLHQQQSKLGSGQMLHFNRSWMTSRDVLKPNSTVCRTISWSQACDLHMEMLRRVAEALCSVRTRLPPVTEDGCEMHPAPLELLERVETGAVLLVAAFLDHREGTVARHVLDVSELDPQVALALDMFGWLGLVDSFVSPPDKTPSPEAKELTERLAALTDNAFALYERTLRNGSLLEFLALRPAYAVPLQLAVTARLRRDPRSLATLERAVDREHAVPPITLPPIAKLRSRAMRDGSLPTEWIVRLQYVRRILLCTSRPQLLDSTLVYLDYQLACRADQLPDLPTYDGPQNMSQSGRLTAYNEVNHMALCDHLLELGRHVLKYQTAMKTSFYLAQNDHIFPDRRFFMKATCPAGAATSGPSSTERNDIMTWASEHVVKKQRTVYRGERAQNGGSASHANGATEEAQLATIERLRRHLEELTLSADHLEGIPEEPLEPALLARAGRRVRRLAERVQMLPDGAFRQAADKLVGAIQRTVAPSSGRTVVGSEMTVVDICMSMLSPMLTQRGLPVADGSPTESESESESAGAAAALRLCSFCDQRERAPGTFVLCSHCVTGGGAEPPRAYCCEACQTDDWEVSHREDHN